MRRIVSLTVLLILLLSAAIGCVRKDSPAPGCIKYWGMRPIGACFGKSVIMDLRVNPAIGCLSISANNCNGGVLEVDNQCDLPFAIGGVEVGASQRATLDVKEREDGHHALSRAASNFSSYVPEESERIELLGSLGGREVRVSFIKTGKLCE